MLQKEKKKPKALEKKEDKKTWIRGLPKLNGIKRLAGWLAFAFGKLSDRQV